MRALCVTVASSLLPGLCLSSGSPQVSIRSLVVAPCLGRAERGSCVVGIRIAVSLSPVQYECQLALYPLTLRLYATLWISLVTEILGTLH